MGYGLLCVLVGLLILYSVNGVHGWGKEGHYATCKIAESYLTKEALEAVKELLPESASGDLAAVCSWADEVRFRYRWSSALHYIDTPDFKCNYEYSRDCHDEAGRVGRCVVGAINNYTNQLGDSSNSSSAKRHYNLTEAVMFLSHFIGDIHQPLHAGFTGDLGGNNIIVRWYRRKTNLHHVWDDMIIETAMKMFYASDIEIMIASIQNKISGNWSSDLALWEQCQDNQIVCPNDYASESVKLACNYAYRNATPDSILGDDYFLSRLPIVETRLAQGGVRLAATLNRIFPSKTRISQL